MKVLTVINIFNVGVIVPVVVHSQQRGNFKDYN